MASAPSIDFVAEARMRYERRWQAGTFGNPLPLDRPTPVRSIPARPGPFDARPPAPSRAPCRRCGARGDLGCDHQRPFEPPQVEQLDDSETAIVYGPYTPGEDDQIIAGVAAGTTYAEIALAMRRTEGSLASRVRYLKARGLLDG